MNAYINKQKKNVAPVALAKAKNIKRSVDQAKSKLKEVVKNINSLENQLNQIEKINENFSKIADISKGKKNCKIC
jgi:chaperonin cofactor prefoldin